MYLINKKAIGLGSLLHFIEFHLGANKLACKPLINLTSLYRHSQTEDNAFNGAWQVGRLSNDQIRNQKRGTTLGMECFLPELVHRFPAETVSAMRAAAGAWPRCQRIETVIQLLELFLSSTNSS